MNKQSKKLLHDIRFYCNQQPQQNQASGMPYSSYSYSHDHVCWLVTWLIKCGQRETSNNIFHMQSLLNAPNGKRKLSLLKKKTKKQTQASQFSPVTLPWWKYIYMHIGTFIPNTFWVYCSGQSCEIKSYNDEKWPDTCWLFILNVDFYITTTFCIYIYVYFDSPLKCVFFFSWRTWASTPGADRGEGAVDPQSKVGRGGIRSESVWRRQDEEPRAVNAASQANMASRRAGKQLDLRVFFKTKDTGEQ